MLVTVFLPQNRDDRIDPPVIETTGKGIEFVFDRCTWMGPPVAKGNHGLIEASSSKNTIRGFLQDGTTIVEMSGLAKLMIQRNRSDRGDLHHYLIKKMDVTTEGWELYLILWEVDEG